MKITNPITLDVARSNSYICLLAKQFDSNSRYLEITLADNGQPLTIPADASAVLRATRADGTGAVVSGTVANGKATVEIDDYILEVNGAVTLSLEISKDGETLTTPSCNLTVQKADANGWIRVYVADANKVAGNYYITIGGVSYSFTTSQAIPAGGSVYFSSNNATAETRNAAGTVIETGLVLTEGTTGTQLVTDVPTMSFLATIAGRVAALESEMPNKADKDGIIALANNLTPYSADSGATQSVPFINQGTGCGNGESVVGTGSYSQLKKKLGNTVCVNQLVDSDTTEVTIPSGRKYWARINGTDVGGTSDGTAVAVTGGTDKFCDLSLWYGSTDNIPAHLLSHPEDFGRYYSGSLAYNPGQLVNADGSVLTSIGRQMWDETWEVGQYKVTTGEKQAASDRIRSKGTIPCSPNTPIFYYIPANKGNLTVLFYDVQGNYIDYYNFNPVHNFTTPADCYFMTFFSEGSYGTTYANDITFSRYYSGESGYDQYYPSRVLAQIDTGSEVLRSAGAVADEKTPDGTITRRVGVVDLGTLDFEYTTDDTYAGAPYFSVNIRDRMWGSSNLRCVLYATKEGGRGNIPDKSICSWNATNSSSIAIRDSAYTDAAAFKSAMSGVMVYYELATPTTEHGTAFSGASADNFAIDDFGSMYWTQTNGVPQGVEIFYPYDYKAAVDTILNEVNGDVTKLVTAEKVPDAPSSNGTYVLKVTVSSGTPTYSWVAE